MDSIREEKVQIGFTAQFQEFSGKVIRSGRRVSPSMSAFPVRRVLLPLLLLAASPAMAEPGSDRGRGGGPEVRAPRVHDQRPDPQSLAEAVRRVERATGGRILSAERVPFDGRDMNRIKVVDSTGRVRVITEDPQGRPPRGD